jgi:hypothetical protein
MRLRQVDVRLLGDDAMARGIALVQAVSGRSTDLRRRGPAIGRCLVAVSCVSIVARLPFNRTLPRTRWPTAIPWGWSTQKSSCADQTMTGRFRDSAQRESTIARVVTGSWLAAPSRQLSVK